MKNKIRLSVLVLVAVLVSAVLVFARGTAEPDVITIRLGHGGAVDDLRQVASEEFKKVVESETDGRVIVELYPASALGNWREMQEGLQIGTTDIVIEDIGTLERYSDSAALGFLPYTYLNREHWEKVWFDTEVGRDFVSAFEEETGFLLLGSMYRGARNLTAVRPVRARDDLEGLQFRIPGSLAAIKAWERLGAAPLSMDFPEVFGALEQGVIDAQENPFQVIYYDSMYEVAPYITLTEHVHGAFNFQFWGETFDSWPEDVRAAVEVAAEQASRLYNDLIDKEEQEILAKLYEMEDVDIITLSDAEIRRWAEIVRPVREDYPRLADFFAAVDALAP